jgi:hypothetical protein
LICAPRFSGDLGEVLPAVTAVRDVAHHAGFAGKFDQFRVVGKAGATRGKKADQAETARNPSGKNLDAKRRGGLIAHEKILKNGKDGVTVAAPALGR